jgi:hypothetical protein
VFAFGATLAFLAAIASLLRGLGYRIPATVSATDHSHDSNGNPSPSGEAPWH